MGEERYEYTDDDISRVDAALKKMKEIEPPKMQVRSSKAGIIGEFAPMIFDLQKRGWSLPSICEKLKELTTPAEGQPGRPLDISVATLKTYLSRSKKEREKKQEKRQQPKTTISDYGDVVRTEMEKGE
jgi:hypothetical protein